MWVALCLLIVAVLLAVGAWCASHDWIVPSVIFGAAGGIAAMLVLVVIFEPKD